MKAHRVLIADDEPLSRDFLRVLTEHDARFEVTAVCESGHDAIDCASCTSIDVAFLDVRMPGLSGFQTLDRMPSPPPLVVFVTAYSEYAVLAYQCEAIDYVTKPIDPSRFAQTLDRVHARLRERAAAQLGAAPSATAMIRSPLPVDRRLLTGVHQDVVYTDSEIEVIESEGNYVKVRIHGESHLVRESLESFSRKLEFPPFVRTHRSVVVNALAVRTMRYGKTGTAELTLADGYLAPVSRRHRNSVAETLRSVLSHDP